MKSLSLIFVGLLLLLANCAQDDDLLESSCPANGNFVLEVKSGIAAPPSATWMYLTNAFGKIRSEQQTVYPALLEWEDHCGEAYTLNVARQMAYQSPSTGARRAESVHSYFGLQNDQVFNGSALTEEFTYPFTLIAERDIVISGITALDSVLVLDHSYITTDYSQSTGELRLHVPLGTVREKDDWMMFGVRLSGEDFFRAKRVNLIDSTQNAYALSELTDRIEQHTFNFSDHQLKTVKLAYLLAEEEAEKINVGTYYFTPGLTSFTVWLPKLESPLWITSEGRYADEGVWEMSAVFDEAPSILPEPDRTVSSAVKRGNRFEVTATEVGYLRAETFRILTTATSDFWILEGALSVGENSVQIPPMSPAFDQAYPEQNLSESWSDEVFAPRLTVFHFPALSTAGDYWDLRDRPLRERLTYQVHSVAYD